MSRAGRLSPGKTKVGFIGLGNLGCTLAGSLAGAGCDLKVWNRTREKATASGFPIARDPVSLAGEVDILFTCLSDDTALVDLFAAHPGLLSALAGKIHVSMSTLSPAGTGALAACHGKARASFIAAPVMGRPDMVRARQHRILIAGPDDAVERVRPLLEASSGGVTRVGNDPVQAAVLKLGMNFLAGAAIGALAEAFAFIRSGGGAPALLYDIATAGPFNSPLYKAYGAGMLNGDYRQALFALRLGRKDMAMFAEAAEGTAIADALLRRLDGAIVAGEGGFDWTGVYGEYRRRAGLDD